MTQNKERSDRYVLQDLRSSADGKALFWRKEFQGYTTHRSEAHVFTMQDAVKQNMNRTSDIPHDLDDLERFGDEMHSFHLTTNDHLIFSKSQNENSDDGLTLFSANRDSSGLAATETTRVRGAATYFKAKALNLHEFNDDFIPVSRIDAVQNSNSDGTLPLYKAQALSMKVIGLPDPGQQTTTDTSPNTLVLTGELTNEQINSALDEAVKGKEPVQPQPSQNTRIDLSYRSESGKANSTAILPGAITQETLDKITELLIDGYQVIAEQVGLPSPLEEMLQDMDPDETDHVLTSLSAWESGIPSTEDLLTDEHANTDLSPRDLAVGLTSVKWDYRAEQERLDLPMDSPVPNL